MIRTHEDLKRYIRNDNSFVKRDKGHYRYMRKVLDSEYYLVKYLYYLRMQEYYINTHNGNPFKKMCGLIYEAKKHRLGNKLGLDIGANCAEEGLTVFHHGTVIINPDAKIGKNCKLHGNNCIGNNGKENLNPIIGDNVDIGFGAVIIGNVVLADGIIVGANAVVNKSFTTPGVTIAGVPARIIKK